MDLKWPLLLLLLLVLLPVAWALLMRFLPAPEPLTGLPIAHAARLRALPRYRELARQQLLLTQVQLLSVGLVLVGAVWLAARPQHTEVIDRPATAGDLVFCADLTPESRAGTIRALGQVQQLLPALRGEPVRFGLQGFQASAAELVALTDDLDQASAIVQETRQTLQGLGSKGTDGAATGDGLATCVKAFDAPKAQRGRAIVLIGSGSSVGSVLSIAEAAGIAHDAGATVYVVPVGSSPSGQAELRAVAKLTGGAVTKGANPIDDAWSREAVRLDPPPTALRRDGPFLPTVIVLIGLGGLLLAGLRGLFR